MYENKIPVRGEQGPRERERERGEKKKKKHHTTYCHAFKRCCRKAVSSRPVRRALVASFSARVLLTGRPSRFRLGRPRLVVLIAIGRLHEVSMHRLGVGHVEAEVCTVSWV